MSSFICITDSTSGEGRTGRAKSTSTRSSPPFPTRLFHRAWVGLWNGCLAHDLPLNFRSGVRSGAPLVANIHVIISFKRPWSVSQRPWQDSPRRTNHKPVEPRLFAWLLSSSRLSISTSLLFRGTLPSGVPTESPGFSAPYDDRDHNLLAQLLDVPRTRAGLKKPKSSPSRTRSLFI